MLPFMNLDIKDIPILNNAFLEKIRLDKTQAIYVKHFSLNCTMERPPYAMVIKRHANSYGVSFAG
jgi:hypothetical protein